MIKIFGESNRKRGSYRFGEVLLGLVLICILKVYGIEVNSYCQGGQIVSLQGAREGRNDPATDNEMCIQKEENCYRYPCRPTAPRTASKCLPILAASRGVMMTQLHFHPPTHKNEQGQL